MSCNDDRYGLDETDLNRVIAGGAFEKRLNAWLSKGVLGVGTSGTREKRRLSSKPQRHVVDLVRVQRILPGKMRSFQRAIE